MAEIFLRQLDVGASACLLVVAVLLLRLIFKSAPRRLFPLLWGLVGLRLILPAFPAASVSLVPKSGIRAAVASLSGIAETASAVWAIGAAGLLLYGAVSFLRLKSRLGTAVKCGGSVFMSEYVSFPFVLGFFAPRIYLPFGMRAEDEANVILHERAHIRRLDHIIKPLAYLLLVIQWFNPFIWAAYLLLCRDIELACDELVSGRLSCSERASYSQTLLNVSLSRASILACPLAFGGGNLKKRVSFIVSGKRPGAAAKAASLLLIAVLTFCFLTDPAPKAADVRPSRVIARAGAASVLKSPLREDYDRSSPVTWEKEVDEPQTVIAADVTKEIDALMTRFSIVIPDLPEQTEDGAEAIAILSEKGEYPCDFIIIFDGQEIQYLPLPADNADTT